MKRHIFIALIGLCFLLCLTAGAFSAPAHKVKQGDSLHPATKKHHVSADKAKSANGPKKQNLKSGRKLTGQKDQKASAKGAGKHRTARASVSAPPPVISEATESDGEFIEYKVRKGDTLDRVALKFGLEKDDLLESNTNMDKRLAPGRTLLIPKIVETGKEDEYVDLSSRFLKSWKTNEERFMLVKVAKSFMGAPYRYGGDSVRGLDCSAFVKKIYDIFDVQLPRSARDQFKVGPKIAREELTVGDLVFFRTKRYVKYPTHVGIYIGDGNFIHSSSAHYKMGVKIDSLQSDFYYKTFLGGTRVKKSPDEGTDTTKFPDLPYNPNANS
jgi:peptidoglycan DL-endopeptidase LytE